MTGELSPAGRPDDSQSELRASHADRDRVVELLRVAAGDGRLTAAELDERLETALTARTVRELAVLTVDLPGSQEPAPELTAPAARDVLRMVHRGGNAGKVGQWVVPRRMEIQLTGGNVRLDFTEAVIAHQVLHIDAEVRGGNFVIITRPGVVVEADDVETFGGSVRMHPARGPQPPTVLRVEISGRVLGGNLRVNVRRRTFWQRLLGWLRPGDNPAIRS